MSNFSAVVKPSMMTTQRALSFQHPIRHPRSGSASAPKNRSACPLLSKPNRVSYNFQPSPRYQTLGAHSAQPITPKPLATDFLHSPSEDRNRRDLDCRYLQEKRLEGKRSDSDDYYYAVSEPRFNKLVRGNSEHDGDSEDGGSGVDDVVDGDAGGGWSFGVDAEEEEEEEDDDLRPGNKPEPEPSLEDLLALYKFAQSNLQPQ